MTQTTGNLVEGLGFMNEGLGFRVYTHTQTARPVEQRAHKMLGRDGDDSLENEGLDGRALLGNPHRNHRLCSHVTALEPVDCLSANKRTQLTALRQLGPTSLQPLRRGHPPRQRALSLSSSDDPSSQTMLTGLVLRQSALRQSQGCKFLSSSRIISPRNSCPEAGQS